MVTDFDLRLRPDDVFQSVPELHGKPSVGNKNNADHVKLPAGA